MQPDDHDYGLNDAGEEFRNQAASERLFETFGKYRRRSWDGMLRLPHRFVRAQAAWFNRSPPIRPFAWPKGRYCHLLTGAIRQRVLMPVALRRPVVLVASEIAQPADVRLIASSIQVLADGHQQPAASRGTAAGDQTDQRGIGNNPVLSGDRHLAGFASKDGSSTPIPELTSPSLNLSFDFIETNIKVEPGSQIG